MADYNEYNPIRTVGGAYVPCPASYTIGYQDISESDSGRDESGLMHKLKIGQKVTVDLEWNYVTTAQASEILTAFDPEYIDVCYLDAKVGGYVTRNFYVGDRSAPAYNTKMGLWESIKFNIIER